MRFSFGPSELLTVAVLQSRLGRVGKSMKRIGTMRRMGMDRRTDAMKIHVRLFRNLSKFHAIYGIVTLVKAPRPLT